MPTNSDACRSHCPINFALETFGDRWTLLIIRDLIFKSKQTFGEFRKSEEKIATNILADRLKQLEANGIVEKTVAAGNRSSVIYSLTEKGKDLIPVMLEITAWSAKHDTKTNTPVSFEEDLKSSRDQMIKTVRSALD